MSTECPILVWMLYLNREFTLQEYEKCYETMQVCVPHARTLPHAPENAENIHMVISFMLPLLMMRHRRIPRTKYHDYQTHLGKHWIDQDVDSSMNPISRDVPHTVIGYNLAYDNSIVGMVMTQGAQRQVVTIGLGIKQVCVMPLDMSVAAYAESFHHKLTPLERTFISPDQGDAVVLRRLCILLSLKHSYIKAIGQPVGFDWSRLEFNIPEETATGDGRALNGWEFRVWQAMCGVMRQGVVIEEQYQCSCAFWRGTPGTKFVWHKDKKEIEPWVQFLPLDALINVLPKLVE